MLVAFPSIFVADIKIIYGYNFVAPLNEGYECDLNIQVIQEALSPNSVSRIDIQKFWQSLRY